MAPLEATSTSLRAHHPGARRASFVVHLIGRQDVKDCSGAHISRMKEIRGKVFKLQDVSTGSLLSPVILDKRKLKPRETSCFAQGQTANYPGLEPKPPEAQGSFICTAVSVKHLERGSLKGFPRAPSRSMTPEVSRNLRAGGWTV